MYITQLIRENSINNSKIKGKYIKREKEGGVRSREEEGKRDNGKVKIWIPACAGMAEEIAVLRSQ